ncbi:MAG TPA: DNA replication and repair protein RecF [Bdellovibrionales bacterium]|mgnify:CR=1 FL=1|nr:DNA replication and repair protein RecF [Bdellovibrionales bacterium]
MRFHSLRLKNFRNYRDLTLEFPPGIVVFCGENGQGKTNLVEAFHFLLRGESFRPATVETLLRHEESGHAPSGLIEGRLSQKTLQHDLKLTLNERGRGVMWNNHRTNSAALARAFPLVLFSPESLAAIKEGPEQRRRLLDDVVLTHSQSSVKILKDFKHALKTRNRVLKDTLKGKLAREPARHLLESLDASYLPLATELTVARLNALTALQTDFQKAISYVLDRSDVDIAVEYLISGQNAATWSRSDILSAMHNRGLELRERELGVGASLVGPQRHDIRILFAGKDSRFFCSQGQQRALVLSFKMAQILYHYRSYQVYPFLLLDDVLSELDPIRRTNLVKFLRDIPAQIFLTTTDLSFSLDFGDRRLNVFRIENGTVSS